MAKSTAEQLRELYEQLAVLTERDATRQREVEELKAVVEREREGRVEAQLENATPRQENAVLRQLVQDHIAQYQEWDRRRWTLITLLIAAVFSLASGLVVALTKK